MKIKKGQNVKIITGKDKGKTGKVLRVIPRNNLVVVEGINIVKKHQKSKGQQQGGGIIEKPMPVHISNIKLEQESKKIYPVAQPKAGGTGAKK
ncbi:50S ribosomal protein L24 [Patescibacteria group bacterium]|nr:50S ribosomal protein L24 [Patescibacteria group bacterium]MBU4057514.1 50S ribosomal protein L24 [Patescibacteria group bacterium]MBU4115739.1 50S ribosomal protein L24 [Patescibacteria group bacterium]